jgi:hypothetical protein
VEAETGEDGLLIPALVFSSGSGLLPTEVEEASSKMSFVVGW